MGGNYENWFGPEMVFVTRLSSGFIGETVASSSNVCKGDDMYR